MNRWYAGGGARAGGVGCIIGVIWDGTVGVGWDWGYMSPHRARHGSEHGLASAHAGLEIALPQITMDRWMEEEMVIPSAGGSAPDMYSSAPSAVAPAQVSIAWHMYPIIGIGRRVLLHSITLSRCPCGLCLCKL